MPLMPPLPVSPLYAFLADAAIRRYCHILRCRDAASPPSLLPPICYATVAAYQELEETGCEGQAMRHSHAIFTLHSAITTPRYIEAAARHSPPALRHLALRHTVTTPTATFARRYYHNYCYHYYYYLPLLLLRFIFFAIHYHYFSAAISHGYATIDKSIHDAAMILIAIATYMLLILLLRGANALRDVAARWRY